MITNLNMDLGKPIVIEANDREWIDSRLPGVERQLLERDEAQKPRRMRCTASSGVEQPPQAPIRLALRCEGTPRRAELYLTQSLPELLHAPRHSLAAQR